MTLQNSGDYAHVGDVDIKAKRGSTDYAASYLDDRQRQDVTLVSLLQFPVFSIRLSCPDKCDAAWGK